MVSGSRHQSQPSHLMSFLQHPGSLISTMALLHGTGSSPSVMMRHQTLYHPHTKHSDVWRWLWQFFLCDMQRTHQHVLSAKMRCGGTHPVSLSNFTHSGNLSLTTVTTNPGFTAHWSSVLDNLCDWLTSVERVNWYISAGLVNSSNSVGDFRIPRSSCCSILGHPALSGHSLFPLWFG